MTSDDTTGVSTIVVLYLGRILEIGTAEEIFSGPRHAYTEALLSAVPNIDGTPSKRIEPTGDGPSAINGQTGCIFQSRCHRKIGAICEETEPPLATIDFRTFELDSTNLQMRESQNRGRTGAKAVLGC